MRPGGADPAGPSPARRAAERAGRASERLAVLLLAAKGWCILGRRVRLAAIEVDVIARRGRTVAFVEVKARPTPAEALEAVGPATRRRLAAAAREWLARNPRHADATLRFDIVAIAPGRWPRHVANAFDAGEPS